MKEGKQKKQKPTKLSEMLAQLHGRYKWEGTWPAFPRALRSHEAVARRVPIKHRVQIAEAKADGSIKFVEVKVEQPPDAPPNWVENIYECLFQKLLPLKKGMTIESLDAAIFGYFYSSNSRELTERMDKCKSLPPHSKDRLVTEELAKHYKPTLEACRSRINAILTDWKLADSADYLKCFAYGIECQQREKWWMPTATTETLQIYKALLRCQSEVKMLIHRGKTSNELGEYIAKKATLSDGKTTHSSAFWGTPEKKATYQKTFQTLCARVGIPLPPAGRPRQIPTVKI